MLKNQEVTTKENVRKFDDDVRKTGSYAYTADRLSARLANARMSESIAQSYDFKGKRVLDLGCGDGTYTLEFPALGVKEVLGVDPASVAIESANAKAKKLGFNATVTFEVGNIYDLGSLLDNGRFDCIVIRGVLHHLPDPERAITALEKFRGTVVVLEPNGNNPVLKVLEKFSRYHIEHEERSFSPRLIRSWFTSNGFSISSCKVLNLVPMFCPDWMARTLKAIGPFIEHLPYLRNISCGQTVIVATK